MCIIQGNIEQVSNTRIFVAPAESYNSGTPRRRQLTIYSNRVRQRPHHADPRGRWVPSSDRRLDYGISDRETISSRTTSTLIPDGPTPAMILPAVSFLHGADVVPIDMTGCNDVFDKLDQAFPRDEVFWNAASRGMPLSTNSYDALPVVKVGSYDVSVVPTRDDFGRLSKKHFVLDPKVAQLFSERYAQNYAFVVCRLRQGESFHPIAYVSGLSAEGALFVPTYHYHGHENETVPDWDHTIYATAGYEGARLRTDSLVPLEQKLDLADKTAGTSALRKLQSKLPILLDALDAQTLSRTKIRTLRQNCDLVFR